jgi:hypothetical protein
VPLSLANAINVHTPPRASKTFLDAVVSLLNGARSGADVTTMVTFTAIGSDIDPAPLQVKRVPRGRTSNDGQRHSELQQSLRDSFARKALATTPLTKLHVYLQPTGGSDARLQGFVLPMFLLQNSI